MWKFTKCVFVFTNYLSLWKIFVCTMAYWTASRLSQKKHYNLDLPYGNNNIHFKNETKMEIGENWTNNPIKKKKFGKKIPQQSDNETIDNCIPPNKYMKSGAS